MTRLALRRWFWVHKWTSLLCTIFLVLICVTGLPLVFREEIEDLLDNSRPYASTPDGTPAISIDKLVAASRRMHPGEQILSISVDDDEPKIMVYMAPSWDMWKANPKSVHSIKFDAHTGQVLKETRPNGEDGPAFLNTVLSLHRDLFAGLPGELFMGTMALLFVVALISGVAVYGPFMRKLNFGTVRTDRSSRLKWLDMHNMVGIVGLCWMLIVGATGVLNELSTPLFTLWQQTDVKATLVPWQGKPIPKDEDLSSPQAAYDKVGTALPGMIATSIIYPGAPFGSPFHYLIWAKGREPLTSRLFTPALVDARTGEVSSIVAMPWYLRALEMSRPLHFGDYGGMPLKIIWALLDLATIIVLGSGLYLWLSRRMSLADEAEDDLVASHAASLPVRPQEAAE